MRCSRYTYQRELPRAIFRVTEIARVLGGSLTLIFDFFVCDEQSSNRYAFSLEGFALLLGRQPLDEERDVLPLEVDLLRGEPLRKIRQLGPQELRGVLKRK